MIAEKYTIEDTFVAWTDGTEIVRFKLPADIAEMLGDYSPEHIASELDHYAVDNDYLSLFDGIVMSVDSAHEAEQDARQWLEHCRSMSDQRRYL